MAEMRTRRSVLFIIMLVGLIAALAIAKAPARAASGRGRIVILMVWDGLRPDSVTARDTPDLFEMAHQGVRFDHHHSMYPTLTMVNAAALATGATPGQNGILANTMYLAPALADRSAALAGSPLKEKIDKPLSAENTMLLASLNGENAFAGHLLGLDTIAQEVEREGGYLAVTGKEGPTFLFDNRVVSVKDGRDSILEQHKDYLFVTDDLTEPPQAAAEVKVPAGSSEGAADSARDQYFTRIVTERAIPAAKLASEAGRPSLIVLWQHDPDRTQHAAGLGTLPALEALSASDLNLGKIRAAIDAAGIADRTDLIVVSDHGFATVRMKVDLSGLLSAAGLKKAQGSDDVLVVRNGGTDLIYLSNTAFPTEDARRGELQKIVNFAEAQEWCGPIFCRKLAPTVSQGRHHQKQPVEKPYLGWIDGTFAQDSVGIFNPVRSPDLVISFREFSDQSNAGLTGPDAPAFALTAAGQSQMKNGSKILVHPVEGVVYADAGSGFTAGMGAHGAAGRYELHNFCAAVGPSFRRGFVDANPTANIDVAPTITEILNLAPNLGPGGIRPTGRVMTEALAGERQWVGSSKPVSLSSKLELQGVAVTTTLKLTRLGDRDYLDDSNVVRTPLGSSP